MFIVGLLLLIACGLSWVLLGIAMGSAERRGLSNPLILLVDAAAICLICGAVLLRHPDAPMDMRVFLATAASLFLSGFMNYWQLIFMGKAMKDGPNGVIWTVLQSGMIFPFLVGVIFYRDQLSAVRVIGMLLILVTLALYGAGTAGEKAPSAQRAPKSWLSDWRLYMLLAFLCTGMDQIFAQRPSYYPETANFSACSRVLWCYLGFIAAFAGHQLRNMLKSEFWKQLQDRQVWIISLTLAAVSLLAGFFCHYHGMDIVTRAGHGAISYPVMVCSCILGFAAFSIFVLHEKNSLKQKLALITAIVGIVLVSITPAQ